jgi:uncharacterized YigZ family protein
MGFCDKKDSALMQRLHRGKGIIFFETRKIIETLLRDPFSFATIAEPSEGAYREKGSRFLAFAFPVTSEAEIKDHLSRLQKKYFDARHHCYAWMLGPEGKAFRAFDDGEPNHSAGDPILGQIRSKGVTNVLVVVVRYFGGIKLGVGGLVTAYKTAAADALDHATIIHKEVTQTIRVRYNYEATPEVMRLVREFDMKILSQDFGASCEMLSEFGARHESKVVEKLELMRNTGVKVDFERESQP